MTWEIFLGIVALVSFITAVTGPLLKLNGSITKLNASVDVIKIALDRIDTNNEKSHKELWDHNDIQDRSISEHERRLNNIEHTMDVTERLHPELTGLRADLSKE